MKLHPPIVLYIMRTLVDGFHKIVRHHHWIQKPSIVLALLLIVLSFLAMVQQQRGCNLIVFNSLSDPSAHITTPTRSNRTPISTYIQDTQRSSFQLYSRLHTNNNWMFIFYCCHNCNHSTYIFNTSSIDLSILQLKKVKYMDRIHFKC